MDFHLADVKSVVESQQVEEVNKYLKWGYVLLNCGCGRKSITEEPIIKYSLGWTGNGPAPKMPEYK